MSKYDATVIIPTYNRIDELRLTLSSLAVQVCKFTFEVIVADDGSSENTLALIKEYVNKLDLKYFYHKDNGFRAAATRNRGIRLSEGNICVFVDNGIILHSEAIENHILAHRNEKNPCAVVGYVYGLEVKSLSVQNCIELKEIINNNSPDVAIQILSKKNICDTRESIYSVLGDEIYLWPAPFLICWTCNLSVPRDVLIEIGMFDEYFSSWGGEDTDLGLSLQKNNIKFILSRNSSSIHYPHKKEVLSQWEGNKCEAIAHLEHIKRYLLKKHPIPAMQQWMKIYDPIKLNKSLLEKNNHLV